MPVEVALSTPLAEALQNAIQSKVAEAGWSGLDDSGLAEYILLMLVNGRNTEQVAAELSTDILDVAPDDENTLNFARWLFDQAAVLSGQKPESSTASIPSTVPPSTSVDAALTQASFASNGAEIPEQDAVMGDAAEGQAAGAMYVTTPYEPRALVTDAGFRPTGPKSMQNGTSVTPTGPKIRDKRMIGQVNKAMSRTPENSLHRIKGLANSGRINTHNRDAPKGPAPKGPRANMRNTPQSARMQNAMQNQMNGMMPQPAPGPALTPQQQMQMLAMYEGMMAQIMSPQQQQEMMQGGMGFGMGMSGMNQMGQQPAQTGKSLFERVDTRTQRQNGNFKSRQNQQVRQDSGADGMDLTSSMEVESGSQPGPRPDPSSTICRYNLFCTKADCNFIHQSPAAPPDTTIDMEDTCSYGAACTNKKCVGKHPSPAQKMVHQTTAMCKFFPNCTNPHCPFQHPSTMCRNGADCTKAGCTFTHSTVACKFNPCLNPMCTFKHAEGQKRGKFQDKVWINPEADEGENSQEQHLSERKFIDDNAEEELIIPGKSEEIEGVKAEEIAT